MTDKELTEALELFHHKLKNQLHSVGINLDVLKTKLKKTVPGEKDILKHLDLVSEQSQKITDVVIEFIKYSKMKDNDRKKVNLRKLLEGALK